MPSRRKSAQMSRRIKPRRSAARPRRPARAHLLVIECDSRQLAADRLNFGRPFAEFLKTLFPDKIIAFVQTSSEPELARDLARVFEEHGRFRSILVLGHSNESGLVLTADGLRNWGVVGNWLRQLEPEFCFLAACRAGRSAAVRELFAPISKLRQIFASPAAVYPHQLSPLAVLVCILLKDSRIDEDTSTALRFANYVLTGGQLYRWKRRESGPGEEITGTLLDFAADLLDRGPTNLLNQIFPRTRPGA
ncbi:MAG: hypothetical protein ABSD45_20145 [Terriglobia bacterium]|jgi:hypothetical protein